MNKNILILIFYILSSFFSLFILNNLKESKINDYKSKQYIKTIDKTKLYLKTLIAEKENATLTIALSLSKSKDVSDALNHNNPNLVNLKSFFLSLRKNTDFKNVWFQIITKDGKSLQRSWIDKKDDQVSEVRLDIQQMLKKTKNYDYY